MIPYKKRFIAGGEFETLNCAASSDVHRFLPSHDKSTKYAQ